MKKFSIKDLIQIIGASVGPNIDSDLCITGVSTDSRTVESGDCFFAVAGENFDGHDYIDQALAKGAVCAVVSNDLTGQKILKVEDTIKALGNLAGQYRRRSNFKVAAITGTVGKTTVRQIAYHVLACRFRVFQSPKNFNNTIGLPLTLLGAGPDDEVVLAELGTNQPGEIAYLSAIALPDIAVITNVHLSHLAGLGNIQTIIQEKLSIAEHITSRGTLIINGDSPRLLEACRAANLKFIAFGKSNHCDIRAQDITYDGSLSRFTVDDTEITLPLAGPGNIENALAAWAICRQLSVTIDDFAEVVKTLPAVAMRAEILKLKTLTVINDCYNANPASMKNALEILKNLSSKENKRSVFICGPMAELGSQSDKLHAELGDDITKAKVNLLIAVGPDAKIAAEIAKAEHDLQIKYFEDTVSACNNLEKFIKDSDIILVKGSRTAKLELVVAKLKESIVQTQSRIPEVV